MVKLDEHHVVMTTLPSPIYNHLDLDFSLKTTQGKRLKLKVTVIACILTSPLTIFSYKVTNLK